ncbi:MAG: ZIP family metal transporter [Candidatus Izemoplasmatales bacterium]|jgi:ZIP family zinc transporter|nr:ZIP family metal transporter [Candidatus Izemoplasmatales bacterium]MDD3865329.1 ZIP family metal transporter [Candidatus Izemoplasmatales bacterium]
MWGLDPITIAILGIIFIFVMTALGSATVFCFKNVMSNMTKRIFLGFAAGVMTAASIWGLLNPAIAQAESMGITGWIPAAIGFAAGGIFMLLLDMILPHLHIGSDKPEGLRSSTKRSTMLLFAMTLHNVPEGLAVGLAFGAALTNGSALALGSAVGLALGIGIQNLPEGAAVSLPLKEEILSAKKAFLLGSLSGIVEPIFAVVGILLAGALTMAMPWLLAFAAGAMIYVVVEELIPEAQLGSHSNIGTIAVMVGFILMMILDIALG